jgi:hypothetical protein
MSRKLTQEIFREDCVGDSSGKHNYNLLSLDTNICNISSRYFIVPNNINLIFNDFISNTESFTQANNLFLDPKRFNLVSASVNLLSSYWTKHEFSVHYPLNISLLENITISCPTVNQLNEKLISSAKTYLNTNYIATNFEENTNVNVIFFLYNVPVNPNNPNDLITSKTSSEFSFNVRHMYAEFIKQDISLGNGKIFKFKNVNKTWILQGASIGSTDSTKQPVFVQTNPPRILTRRDSINSRSKIDIIISSNTFNFDLYYYAVSSGVYFSGITDITLTINSGIYLGANSTDSSALTISGFSVGDTIKIINNGNIIGYGGKGGDGLDLGTIPSGDNNGKDGGDAILLRFPVLSIVNNGIIGGGGGGGAGGIASYLDNGYLKNYFDPTNKKERKAYANFSILSIGSGGGGGGGAGYLGGYNGEAGSISQAAIQTARRQYLWTLQPPAQNGNIGTFFAGGVGGSGSTYGGNGGLLGQQGTSTGKTDSNGIAYPPFGGVAGYAIRGKSFLSSITTTVANSSNLKGDVRGIIAD